MRHILRLLPLMAIYVSIISYMEKRVDLLYTFLLMFMLFSCGHEPKAENLGETSNTRPRDELSLKADRSALDEERKQIPPETKRSNDEMALILQLMQTNDLGEMQDPSKIRERFDKVVREKRTKLDREVQKSRADFAKNEKTSRDLYFANLKTKREEFAKEKHDSETRSQFFSDQDQKRRDFTADLQEKRSSFETDVREKRKDFEDYIHERQSSFNDEYRSYSKRYDEARKNNSLKKNMQEKERKMKTEQLQRSTIGGESTVGTPTALKPANQKDLDDFQSFPKTPGQPLDQDQ